MAELQLWVIGQVSDVEQPFGWRPRRMGGRQQLAWFCPV